MSFYWRGKRYPLLIGGVVLILVVAFAILRPPSLRRLADRVQVDVAEIRGLEFKRPVPVQRLSREEWRGFVEEQVRKMYPIEHYWSMVRMLGLYRGPDLAPPQEYFVDFYAAAAGAYDARAGRFVWMSDMAPWQIEVVFAHELQHALQDQHYDLQKYLLDLAEQRDANSDVLLARQSVVEGEAAYVDSIYQARQAGVEIPTREQIAEVIAGQAAWNPDTWEQMLENPKLTGETREHLREAIEMRRRLPPFVFELAMSPYIEGMKFIHALRERGWTEVTRLYGEYPPVSTEQILHPEKWFARETPMNIDWPTFEADPRFAEWQLLVENTLGERQMQTVFRVQEQGPDALVAAAGWNGDRYAVFRHRNSDDCLMLLFTAWDTDEDAAEFAAAYRRLLESKYSQRPIPARVRLQGNTVHIVEGADETSLDVLLGMMPVISH